MIARLGAVLAAALALVFTAAAHRNGPPLAYTGGFGEPTCHECHFDEALDSPGGSLEVRGFPPVYEPGRTYDLEIVLFQPELEVAGFQLAVRFAEGSRRASSAGSLEAVSAGVAIVRDERSGTRFAQHRVEGTVPDAGDSARWSLAWTAPAKADGPVLLHAAANAGNGDDSPFGDRIRTASARADASPSARDRAGAEGEAGPRTRRR